MTSIASVNVLNLSRNAGRIWHNCQHLGCQTSYWTQASAQGCNSSTYGETACLLALHCTWAHLNQSLVGNLTSSRWLTSCVIQRLGVVWAPFQFLHQIHHHILFKLADATTGKNCRSHADRNVTVPTIRHSYVSSWIIVVRGWQVYKGENWPGMTLHSPILSSCPRVLNL